MVLTDDNFATIVKAVGNGTKYLRKSRKAIQFLYLGNTAAYSCCTVCISSQDFRSICPGTLFFINLLTDSLPAIALGLEPHSKV